MFFLFFFIIDSSLSFVASVKHSMESIICMVDSNNV